MKAPRMLSNNLCPITFPALLFSQRPNHCVDMTFSTCKSTYLIRTMRRTASNPSAVRR